MKVIVTPLDIHPVEGHPGTFYDYGSPYTGQGIIASSAHVMVDGKVVLLRDRRMKTNRVAGHPWLDPLTGNSWTGFRVEVEP